MANKSTNGRSIAWSVLRRAAPGVAARLALRRFVTPPPPRALSFEQAPEPFALRVGAERVQGFAFGASGPAVVLVHGWGGAAAQLGAFVGPLCAAGFRVLAFDAPAHGASSGRYATIKLFARCIEELARAHGVPRGIVAHSLGCAAATMAVASGLRVERAVYFAPLADPHALFQQLADRSGLPLSAFVRVVENRYGVAWRELALLERARDLEQPLLIFHDRSDRAVPLRESEALAAAWPGAELRRTEGLGHRQLLRDGALVEATVDFLRPILTQSG